MSLISKVFAPDDIFGRDRIRFGVLELGQVGADQEGATWEERELAD